MRKFFVLCAAIFCLSCTASAQDSSAAFDASSSADSEPAAATTLFQPERLAWQIGAGFQYSHFNVLGVQYSNFGYRADITRYLTNSIGLEGSTIEGFGHTGSNPNLIAKSFFIGVGPHVSLHTGARIEPWVHAMIGWERFRYEQAGPFGANPGYAFVFGGGVDYKIGEGRLHWRTQADFIGAHVPSVITKNFSFGSGLVYNF